MSENYKIQISPKLPDGTLINLRADNPDELDYLIGAVENRAAAIAGLVGTLGASAAVGKIAAPASQQPSQPPAWGSPSGQSSSPAQTSSPAPGNVAPSCDHGAMVYRTGNGQKGPWKAYFCPLPKERKAEQCSPEFVR